MVYNVNYKIKALSMYNNNTRITSESSAQVITSCDI